MSCDFNRAGVVVRARALPAATRAESLAILLIGDVLDPGGSFPVELFLDGDVGHAREVGFVPRYSSLSGVMGRSRMRLPVAW